jgi:hypothetical protein
MDEGLPKSRWHAVIAGQRKFVLRLYSIYYKVCKDEKADQQLERS